MHATPDCLESGPAVPPLTNRSISQRFFNHCRAYKWCFYQLRSSLRPKQEVLESIKQQSSWLVHQPKFSHPPAPVEVQDIARKTTDWGKGGKRRTCCHSIIVSSGLTMVLIVPLSVPISECDSMDTMVAPLPPSLHLKGWGESWCYCWKFYHWEGAFCPYWHWEEARPNMCLGATGGQFIRKTSSWGPLQGFAPRFPIAFGHLEQDLNNLYGIQYTGFW